MVDWGGVIGGLAQAGAQYAGSAIQGASSRDFAARQAQQNYEHQKEFATSGIQWKVADALKAGVHPLAALGASTISFGPQSVGDTGEGAGKGLADAGQGIGRALQAAMGSDERELHKIQIEGAQLDNDLKRSELRKMNAQLGPGIPKGKVDPLVPPEVQEQNVQDPQHTRIEGKDYVTGPWGIQIKRGKGMDAQSWEDVYGQAGEFFGGLMNMVESGHLTAADAFSRIQDWARRKGARVVPAHKGGGGW